MSDPATPQTLASEFADLNRRLAALERSPQLKSSSIKGGALTIYDASGNAIVQMGEIDTDQHGLLVTNAAGATLLKVYGEEGFGAPVRGFPWRESSPVFESTTSATFVGMWQAHLPAVEADGVYMSNCTITLNAADTAEVKVYVDGSTETDTLTLSGATATQWAVKLNWEHGLTRGVGPYGFHLQVRRSAGTAAAVNVYEPSVFEERSATSSVATSGGLTAS
jgi:hypothetical protein